MAESDYVCLAVFAADMATVAEYHHETESGGNPITATAITEYTGTFGWNLTGRKNSMGAQRIPDEALTIRVGYWLRWTGWLPSSQDLFRILDRQQEFVTLKIWLDETSYSIKVEEDDVGLGNFTVLAQSFNINALLSGTDEWKHIGIFYDPINGLLTLYINGRVILNAVGITIGNPGNAFIGHSYTSGNYVSADDVYIEYSPNAEVNMAPPARRFYPALPSGVGEADDWTPQGAATNWECVDEPSAPDDTTTYISAETNGLLDMYQFTNVTLPPNESVTAALVQAYVRITSGRDGGWAALTFAFKGTMNSAYGNTKWIAYNWPTDNEWVVLTDRMTTLPQGGAWTVSEFNGGQFGYESANLI